VPKSRIDIREPSCCFVCEAAMLLEWLESHLRVKRDRGDAYRACCPLCENHGKSPDTKFHMGISLKENFQAFHCFRCDSSGSVLELLHELGLPWKDAHVLIGLKRGRQGTFPPLTAPISGKVVAQAFPVPKECKPLSGTRPRHAAALRYLYKRGVGQDLIEKYKLGFCVLGDYAQRVVLPVEHEGVMVGFTARAISPDEKPKYKFPPGFKAADYLYNFDNAKSSSYVVLTEGPYDAMRLPDSAVALFGNRLSERQKLLITRTWGRAVIMLDRDAAKFAAEMARALSAFMHISVTFVQAKDPGEAEQCEIDHVVAQALRNVNYGLGAFL